MDAMLIDRQAYENGVSQIIQTSLIDVYGVEGYKSIIKTMIKESGKSEKEVTQNYQIFADVIQRIFGRIGDAKILEPIKMEINKFQINHTNTLEKTSDTSSKQIRLLIADDEPHLLELYQEWLKFDNRHVITAENGQKCLEIYQKEHIYSKLNNLENYFDVVILDHNMPVLNGVQTASEILKINPHQRIIFLTK